MRRVSSGSCCTARAAWATPSARTSSSWPRPTQRHQSNLPDENLAYFEEGAQYFGHYVRAVSWAQKFALRNREVMMANLIATVRKVIAKPFESHVEAVNCHHNLCSASATSARTCS